MPVTHHRLAEQDAAKQLAALSPITSTDQLLAAIALQLIIRQHA